MLYSSSLAEFLNVYIVENVSQSLVAALFILPLVAWLVNSSAARIKYLLVALLLPAIGPPLYYLLVPNRRELPVIPLDRLLGLKQGLSFVTQWPVVTDILTIAFMAATLYFLARGTLAVAAAFYLPHRYARLASGQQARLEALLAPILAKSGLGGPPVMLQSPAASHAISYAFGLRRRYLVLSKGLLEGLDDRHLQGVLTHELAHLLRRDQFLNLLLLALRSLFFFNPLVHVLCRLVAQEQELACDALAIRWGQRPLVYAESLVKVWRQRLTTSATWAPAVSGFSPQAHVRRRVNAVLREGGSEGEGHNYLLVAVTSFLSLLLFFIC